MSSDAYIIERQQKIEQLREKRAELAGRMKAKAVRASKQQRDLLLVLPRVRTALFFL